jgi:hypothetical protein
VDTRHLGTGDSGTEISEEGVKLVVNCYGYRLSEEMAVACFKIPFWYLRGGTKQNHEKLQDNKFPNLIKPDLVKLSDSLLYVEVFVKSCNVFKMTGYS